MNATRGALGLVLLCFLLPFFTFTLSSCGGTDASQTLQVTGIQLIRHQHGAVENHTNHAPAVGRAHDVTGAADAGQDNAIAVVVLVGLGLLATLMPRRVRDLLTVPLTAGVAWALFLLATSVDSSYVDVGYEPGFIFGVMLAVGATVAAAVVLFNDRPVEVESDLTPPGGFWIRFGAWVLDALVLVVLGTTAVFLVGNATGHAVPPLVVIVATIVVYRVAAERSPLRGTVGQWMAGLEVTGADGQAVSVPRSALRAVCDLACLVFLFGLGHIVAGMTPGKRALHDVLSGTRVARRAPQSAAETSARAAAFGS